MENIPQMTTCINNTTLLPTSINVNASVIFHGTKYTNSHIHANHKMTSFMLQQQQQTVG